MCNPLPRRLAATIAATVAIAISVCALAGPRHSAGAPIEDADLDMSTWSGVTMLYHRLQDAAMLSCDPSGQTKVLPYFNMPESGDCYADKLYTLLAKYENSALLNVHDRFRLEPIIIE